MNITKEKKKQIITCRKKGYSIRELARRFYPYATGLWGQSIKPIAKVCAGIHYKPIWSREFR